jgi:nicotinate-nucleotide pyrophosphorylase (carboxylating)
MNVPLDYELINKFIIDALNEDIQTGDFSSLACIPHEAKGNAILKVKENGILAGVELAELIFKQLDENADIKVNLVDGVNIHVGEIAFSISTTIQNILKAERLVLNTMQRMSAIATLTNEFVEAVKGTSAIILDTRKTTPLFRYFEKWAVRVGGGQNHRMGLYDMIMLKDNHIDYAGGITNAIRKTQDFLQKENKNLLIEVETRNLEEVQEVLACGGVDRIMLDNFKIADLHKAVKLINHQIKTEASGGVNLNSVREIALSGVDFISVGALTHGVKSIDLSLKAVPF